MMQLILLYIHIICGTIALICAALAIVVEKGKTTHIRVGRLYFRAMFGIFLTAIPMSVFTKNIFLFLIAIFSFYLAFAGRRFASNRKGIPTNIDWIAVSLMLTSGIGMLLLAALFFSQDNSQYIVLIVFGGLALALGYADLHTHKTQTAKGPQRISRHLTNMLGGTIAVITAMLVVNLPTDPAWVAWVLPTALITPIIFWWNKKTLS